MPSGSDQQFSLFDFDRDSTDEDHNSKIIPSGKNSNFIVYVDESGDHSMSVSGKEYPLFVLAFCVFYKRHYSEKVVPALQKLKFNEFGHDIVILHEREIRKETGPFKFQSREAKTRFLEDLTDIIDRSNFILLSCVIDKRKISDRATPSSNPYNIALAFCLETLSDLLKEKNQQDKTTYIIFEGRGKKEDKDLELEFRRICDGANRTQSRMPFEIIFADKRANSCGLQLADLVARPIGMHILRPEQQNRAFDALTKKFFCDGGRRNVGQGYENWGLKVFPPPESEKPR